MLFPHLLLLQVPEDTPVGPPTTDGSMEWFRDVEATRLQDQPPYTSKHNTWLAVRVPVAVAKVSAHHLWSDCVCVLLCLPHCGLCWCHPHAFCGQVEPAAWLHLVLTRCCVGQLSGEAVA